MRARLLSISLSLMLAALGGCGRSGSGPDGSGGDPSGIGYVHYHPYPAHGVCACSGDYDFAAENMMVAAISPAVHALYDDSLCTNKRRYAEITSKSTGKRIRVLISDEGGTATLPFDRREQHIMDLSEKAFQALDIDGKGLHAGRIYVDWKLVPAPLDQPQRALDLAGQ